MSDIILAAHDCRTAAECVLHRAPNYSCPLGPSDHCAALAEHLLLMEAVVEAASESATRYEGGGMYPYRVVRCRACDGAHGEHKTDCPVQTLAAYRAERGLS